MPAGMPPKPVELKKKQGTYRKDRDKSLGTNNLIPFNPIADVPPAPADLQTEGLRVWNTVWTAGATWINPASDSLLVEQAARMKDLFLIAQSRAMVTTDPGDVRAALQANNEYNRMLSQLGFTPADRTKMGVQQVQAVSTLEKLRAKKNG